MAAEFGEKCSEFSSLSLSLFFPLRFFLSSDEFLPLVPGRVTARGMGKMGKRNTGRDGREIAETIHAVGEE